MATTRKKPAATTTDVPAPLIDKDPVPCPTCGASVLPDDQAAHDAWHAGQVRPVCPLCGAVVEDQVSHDAWHGKQMQVVTVVKTNHPEDVPAPEGERVITDDLIPPPVGPQPPADLSVHAWTPAPEPEHEEIHLN
jgi:endogenous inhibitor of DNA gyrase (YacG/DUF329 family)